MGIKHLHIFAFLLGLLLGNPLLAQIDVAKAEVQKLDGKKYYLHEVQQGQTLYAISRAYKVPIENIIESNPEVAEGLKILQILKIPLAEVDKKQAEANAEVLENNIHHKVAPKETLYGITKKYGVSIEDLLQVNDSSIFQLQPEQIIKIPLLLLEEEKQRSFTPAGPDSLILHQVAPKETLYSIARLYSVSIDSIMLINPSVAQGLKVGQTLRIPKIDPEYLLQDTKATVDSAPRSYVSISMDSTLKKPTYTVALFLPFYLQENDSIFADTDTNLPPPVFRKSRIALDFYKGIKLALELDENRNNIELKIFESFENSNKLDELLNSNALDSVDLVIGPLYRSNFEKVAAVCKEKRIHIISPVPLSNAILLDNPHVIKVTPSLAIQSMQLANYLFEHHSDHKITLVDSRKVRDQDLVDLVKSEVKKYYEHEIGEKDCPVRYLQLYDVDTAKLESGLSDTLYNIFFLPSFDQVYVTEFLTNLYKLNQKYPIMVFGLDAWTKFENLPIEYLQNLNVHFSSVYNEALEIAPCEDFVANFRKKYYSEPLYYSYLGFDIANYFFDKLQQKGRFFMTDLDAFESKAVSCGFTFDFYKPVANSGFENAGMKIIKYEDFNVKVVH